MTFAKSMAVTLMALATTAAAVSRYDVLVKDFEEKAQKSVDKFTDGLTEAQKDLLKELVKADEERPSQKALDGLADPVVFERAVKLSASVLADSQVEPKLVDFVVEMLHATTNKSLSADEDEQLAHELEVVGRVLDRYDALSDAQQRTADRLFPGYAAALYRVPQLRAFARRPHQNTVKFLRYKTAMQGR